MSTQPTRPAAGPYAVYCHAQHGMVFLTDAEYDAAMDDPDRPWCCPICGGPAEWSDTNFESWQQYGGDA